MDNRRIEIFTEIFKGGWILMRRTLISTFITFIVILTVIPAQASWVSEMLFGRHSEYRMAGITYAVDEKIPAMWAKDSVLSTRYWKEGAPIFAGTILRIGVLLTTGSEDGRTFAICVSDPSMVIGDYSGDPKAKLPKDQNGLGGLKVLGTFKGKYGFVEWNTSQLEPGTIFLYTYALKGRKYEKFSEQAIVLQIAPPLSEMIPALQNEPDEVLRQWGLEAYPTLEEMVGQRDQSSACFDINFADGGKMSSVRIAGRPEIGRLLGVRDNDKFLGMVRIDNVEDGVVRSSSSSQFLRYLRGRESELRLDWVVQVQTGIDVKASDLDRRPWNAIPVKTTVFIEPDDIVRQGKVPWLNEHNFLAYSHRSRGSGDQTDFIRAGNFAREVRIGSGGHMEVIKCGNRVLMLEVEIEQDIKIPQAKCIKEQYLYVPEYKAKECRVLRLGPGGIPIVKVDEAETSRIDTQGLWAGFAYILGQAVHKPDRTNVNNSATAPTTNNVSSVNNNANSNTNVNPNNNTVNVGDGTATGTATGTGNSTATSDP
ncbi:MAG: hypothetical protein M1429_03130 [Patescibacteria group bacterium]|nr:hypothetical protein [Patescibacteria group bacterium]